MAGDLRYPAEWEPHQSVWMAWPSHPELWGSRELAEVRAEVAALVEAIAGPLARARERVQLCVLSGESRTSAEAALAGLNVRFVEEPFGDIWVRDTGPLFLKNDLGTQPACFGFNGWGGKYRLPGDGDLATRIARYHRGSYPTRHDWILEGGAVDNDGEGTLLTTRQCLLNRNRNPHLSQAEIDGKLREGLGVETILWLDEGLVGDHTDGHVDNLARWIAPGLVCTMEAAGPSDPNYEVLEQAARSLSRMRDNRGQRLEVVRIPSPGLVPDTKGKPLAASHLNFYIANGCVVVPTYNERGDAAAAALAAFDVFGARPVVQLSAKRLIEGGGSFHCITQQVPA